jgi:hypothetical protein
MGLGERTQDGGRDSIQSKAGRKHAEKHGSIEGAGADAGECRRQRRRAHRDEQPFLESGRNRGYRDGHDEHPARIDPDRCRDETEERREHQHHAGDPDANVALLEHDAELLGQERTQGDAARLDAFTHNDVGDRHCSSLS